MKAAKKTVTVGMLTEQMRRMRREFDEERARAVQVATKRSDRIRELEDRLDALSLDKVALLRALESSDPLIGKHVIGKSMIDANERRGVITFVQQGSGKPRIWIEMTHGTVTEIDLEGMVVTPTIVDSRR